MAEFEELDDVLSSAATSIFVIYRFCVRIRRSRMDSAPAPGSRERKILSRASRNALLGIGKTRGSQAAFSQFHVSIYTEGRATGHRGDAPVRDILFIAGITLGLIIHRGLGCVSGI